MNPVPCKRGHNLLQSIYIKKKKFNARLMGLLVSLFVFLHLSCYSSLAMLVLRLKYLSVVFYLHIVGRDEALTEHNSPLEYTESLYPKDMLKFV